MKTVQVQVMSITRVPKDKNDDTLVPASKLLALALALAECAVQLVDVRGAMGSVKVGLTVLELTETITPKAMTAAT